MLDETSQAAAPAVDSTPQVTEAKAQPEPPSKRPIEPIPGEVITSLMTHNSYTMGDKIGEGYFGLVFGCVDLWGNELAAKVMKPLGSYERVRESTEAEFRKLILLRHPNITYLFDAFEYRDTFYLITERCSCSLAELLATDWFDGRFWLKPIARCLLQAVHFIHTNGFCHQDIHPGNVLEAIARDEMAIAGIQADNHAVQFKLGDLGVTKLFEEVSASNTRNAGMFPPEALDSSEFGPLDHRIDIYHCGLLLLQVALSREMQFTNDEIKSGTPRELAEKLPPPLNFALGKALRRHVAVRTESAIELWRDLVSFEPPLVALPEQLELPELPPAPESEGLNEG